MGNCTDLATKADIERLEALVDGKIDKTQEASIVQQAVGISGQAIQAGLALQAGRIANAMDAATSAQQAALGVRTIAQNASTAAGAANSAALNASQAAKKASYDALYAQSRASSAASAASKAASIGGRALSTALNAISIISTLATVAFVAALAKQVSSVIQRVNELDQEVKKLKVIATQADYNARVAVDRANEAIAKALEAIAKADNLSSEVKAATEKANQAKERADDAFYKANEAFSKANQAIETANAINAKADRAIADANIATDKANTAKTTADEAISRIEALEAELRRQRQENQQLKIQIGQLDSDNDALRVQLENALPKVETNKENIAKLETKTEEVKKETLQERLQREYRERLDNLYKSQQELREERQNQINDKFKSQDELRQQRQEQIDAKINEQISKWDIQYQNTNNRLNNQEQIINNQLTNTNDTVNKQEVENLNRKIDETNNNIKNLPSIEKIALAVAGLDVFKQILTNTSNPPRLTCQAPALVPPVSAKVTAVNGAVVGLQSVTIAQSTAIKTAVTQNFNLLSHSQHGLQAIQQFASKAWKATQADKIMNALTTAVVIHNAMMLSSNLASTISEATNMALDALGIKDESDNPIDIGAAVRGKINAVLASILGQENYKALTTRIAAANRVYQASANVYNLVREIGETSRSIAEVACENTGKIGNALLESGVVYENAYEQMIDSVNPQSKAQLKLEKFRNGTEALENAAEAISSISSDVIELQELRTELTEGKTRLQTARQEFKTAMDTKKAEIKTESQANTEVKKQDFGKNEEDIV